MRRSLVGAAGALAALLVLAGCGGDPKADPSPSPSTPSVSTTPSPTAPVMPAAASENTKAGAIAFVRYYIELINHAQATGDVAALAAVEEPGCKSCTQGREYIQGIYSAGGHIENGQLRVRVLSVLRNAAINGWTVDARLSFGPQTVIKPSATPTAQQLQGGSVPITVLISKQTDRWSVTEWTRAR
jgi:hypothetical protein